MSDKIKTDRQTDKSSRWGFTAYEDQYHLLEKMPRALPNGDGKRKFVRNKSPPSAGISSAPVATKVCMVEKIFPGVHIEVAKNWDALVNYCKKKKQEPLVRYLFIK